MDAVNAVLSDFKHLVKSSGRPKYKSIFDKSKEKRYTRRERLTRSIIVSSKCDFDVHFQDFKDVYNTKVFMDNFQRTALNDSKLTTYVTLDDVKDVVLFTAIYDVPREFIRLFLSNQVDRILRSLILYMQYFLEIFRVVVKRRIAVNTNKLRHPISSCVETLWKETLSNLRFVLARDYCYLLMGLNGTEQFHHYDFSRKISRQSRDLMLYQLLNMFAHRVVQVALVEKDNPLLGEEMERLFGVGGLKVDWKKKYGLTQSDVNILQHKFTVAKLQSKSAISKEFARPNRNILLKNIGESPWLSRDAPSYFLAIEMALAGGESRFSDANIRLGLLGFERQDFDCLLNLESSSSREKSVTVSDGDSNSEGTEVAVQRLADKSVHLTGPAFLLPKRDESSPFNFDEKYLCRCENYDENHVTIRRARWVAFRKASSRVNYDPENHLVHRKESKIVEEQRKIETETTAPEVTKSKVLPCFFFSSTAKSDSEDDIYALFHEGFFNEQVKKMAKLNKKV